MRLGHPEEFMGMRQVGGLSIVFCLMILPLPSGESYPYGVDNVKNGCTCHNAVPTEMVIISLEGLPERYEANETYLLNISVTGGAEPVENHTNLGGFNLWFSRGELTNLSEEVQVFSVQEIGHTEAGNDQRAWTASWTAPEDDSLIVLYRLHINTVNGDGVPSDADLWNREAGEVVGINVPQEEPVSNLFLYGVPIVLFSLAGLVYWREMRKIRTDSEEE